MYISNPVVIGDDAVRPVASIERSVLRDRRPKSGKVLWLGPPREAANTAIAKAGDLLFLLNDDGELIVARASRNGMLPVKRYTVADSATWAQPAISGNRFFVRDGANLTLWTLQ